MRRRLLLDTHAFLWAVLEPHKLSPTARAALQDPANRVTVSAVNVWEIAIKSPPGKLPMPSDGPRRLRAVADSTRFEILSVTVEHAFSVCELPGYHKDPFDGLLVAQVMTERMTLVSDDVNLSRYGVDVL